MGAKKSKFTEHHKNLLGRATNLLLEKPGNTICIISTRENFAIRSLLEQQGWNLSGNNNFAYFDADSVRYIEKFGVGTVIADGVDTFPPNIELRCKITDYETRDPGLDSYSRNWRGAVGVYHENKRLCGWSFTDACNQPKMVAQCKHFGVDFNANASGEMTFVPAVIPKIITRTFIPVTDLSCHCEEDCGSQKESPLKYEQTAQKPCKWCKCSGTVGSICACGTFSCQQCLGTGIVTIDSQLKCGLDLAWLKYGFACCQECHNKKPIVAAAIEKEFQEKLKEENERKERAQLRNMETRWREKCFNETYTSITKDRPVADTTAYVDTTTKPFVLTSANIRSFLGIIRESNCNFCHDRQSCEYSQCVTCDKVMCKTCQRSGRPTIRGGVSGWYYQWNFEYNKYGFACCEDCHSSKPQVRVEAEDARYRKRAQEHVDKLWKAHGSNIIAFFGVWMNELSEGVREQVLNDDPNVVDNLDKSDLYLVAAMNDKPKIHAVLVKRQTEVLASIALVVWVDWKAFHSTMTCCKASLTRCSRPDRCSQCESGRLETHPNSFVRASLGQKA